MPPRSDLDVEVAGIRLEADEVEVRPQRHEHIALAQDGTWAVALDLELTLDGHDVGITITRV